MAHRTEWEVSGDKSATRGIQDPLGLKGEPGEEHGGDELGHSSEPEPCGFREGRVREVQGGAEEVSVKFRKIWKHVRDLLIE